MEKAFGVLRSRKFWAAVIGLLAAVGVVRVEDGAELAAVIAAGVSGVYILATAIEDGLSRRGE